MSMALGDQETIPIFAHHVADEKLYRHFIARHVLEAVRLGHRHPFPTLTATVLLAGKRMQLVRRQPDKVHFITIIRIQECAKRKRSLRSESFRRRFFAGISAVR